MQVEIVYIALNVEFVKKIHVPAGSTVQNAIEQSGLLETHSEISLDKNKVGVFGEIVSLEMYVKQEDRIEIYRPLTMDPMEARRLRVLSKS